MAQIKKIGSDSSKQNNSYWSQQGDQPAPGATTVHPKQVQKLVGSEQAQQLQDKAGA